MGALGRQHNMAAQARQLDDSVGSPILPFLM